MGTDPINIVRNESQNRFEAEVAGMRAFVDYVLMGKRIIYTHTEVPEQLEGQGIGSQLARHVLDYARNEGLGVMPLCPFIAEWIRNHPEYRSLVIPGFAL